MRITLGRYHPDNTLERFRPQVDPAWELVSMGSWSQSPYHSGEVSYWLANPQPGLKDFLIQPAIGYPYKKYHLAVQPGSILGRLRTLLAKRDGVHRDLTHEARRDWTNLIEYNRQDVLGMKHLVEYVQAGFNGNLSA
jgi:hypothetical protein